MKINKPLKKYISAFIILVGFFNSGMAQRNGSEKGLKNMVWEMQVHSISVSCDLDKKEISKLTNAYLKVRQDVEKQNKQINQKTDPDAYVANTIKNENEGREQIKKNIDKILEGEQAEEALLLLGSFNSRWDTYQKILLDFNLEKEQLEASSKSLAEYMKVYLKERKLAEEEGERFSGRIATELKNNLDKSLSSILSQEQMDEWISATKFKKKNG
ncbi:MAG: hypothetical protein JW973_18240 [Bacteroidales bacterium]|nr:hypothetical protein [Bacteroidales bacterium]MBN2763567.1 hypothetical protein [Bacteroidales bacterium]